jgi:thiamine-monophosphate kinase
MKNLDKISENKAINHWVRHFSRSPDQINEPHKSDAELIRINGNNTHFLAVTIDSVSEEIHEGLYRDPFTMGWVAVMANFSDLAAVGADPIGIVMSISLEPERNNKFREGIAKGIDAACRELGVFVLGGDTNSARKISLTGCAFGLVPNEKKISRTGLDAGDAVFLSGGAGKGNVLGLVRMADLPEDYYSEKQYRPKARIKEARMIRNYASSCMDTSDGLLITLDQLFRVNNKGFILEADWETILSPEVYQFCETAKIPSWFMAAGIHGEFELVFTIPSSRFDSFLMEAESMEFNPICLGHVQNKPSIEFLLPRKKKVKIDMSPLRNLWNSNGLDLSILIQKYHAWGKKWGFE